MLVAKAMAALDVTGSPQAGRGRRRRRQPRAARAPSRGRGESAAPRCSFPTSQFCTDNGAMIALVGALRLERSGTSRLRLQRAAALAARIGWPTPPRLRPARVSAGSPAVMRSVLAADLSFLPREQPLDVRSMTPDQQQRDREERPRLGPVAEEIEAQRRRGHGGRERSQRGHAKQQREHDPDAQRARLRAFHDSAKATPAAVDTPLPPEKPMEHRIDVTEEHGERRAGGRQRSVTPARAEARARAIPPAQPLPASPASVSAAAILFPVRSTLVAPGLPEP